MVVVQGQYIIQVLGFVFYFDSFRGCLVLMRTTRM